MIGYLNGIIKKIRDENILLDVHGIGYRVFVNRSEIQNLHENEPAEFFIHTHVSSDSIRLFGFRDESELDLFEVLIAISGIGVKTAMNILATLSLQELSIAVYEKNPAMISKIPGVGKKSAERLIIELAGKIPQSVSNSNLDARSKNEAMQALEALGYSQQEILTVFQDAPANSTTESLIKLALKQLSKF